MKRARDRDAAIDRMLGAVLGASAQATDACPQAGDLAAFIEGGLSKPERDTIERHAAACERCQRALALAESTLPPAAAARPVRSTRPIVWLRWAIPAASVAAILFLYMGIRSTITPDMARTVVSRAPIAERRVEVLQPSHPVADASKPQSTAVRPEPVGTVRPDRAASQTRGSTSSPRPEPVEGRQNASRIIEGESRSASGHVRPAARAPVQASPAAPSEQTATAQAQARQNPPAQAMAGVAGGVGPFRQPAPAQEAPAQTTTQQAQAQAAPAPVVVDRVERFKVAAAPAPAPGVQLKAESLTVGESIVTAAPPVVAVPGQLVRWRLEPNGGISRSADAGRTWILQSYRPPSPLLAGSAPSANVCWLVGPGGLVLLTTGAERWDRRPFPERVDLVAVDALDALHATVTARDGRRFVTDDGGATWR